MLSCKQVSQLVTEADFRRLSWRERLGMRLHLLICVACARFERQAAFLRTAARRYADRVESGGLGPALPDAARERIADRLRQGP